MAIDNPFSKKSGIPGIPENPKWKIPGPGDQTINLKDELVVKEVIKEVIKEEVKIPEEKTQQESMKSRILKAHGGLESNIPINSPYWRH